MAEIQGSWKLNNHFISWNEAQKETFLDICTGQRGVKILFDSFFKELFNPEYNPEQICDLIQKFPMFKEMYEDIFHLCQNTERVMNMYFKELAELDHNTAEYMVDEMQKDLDEARDIIRKKENTIQSQSDELAKAYALIEKLQKTQQVKE